MGKRRAPRVEQKLPARIYGLDHNGKPFSVKVETLDVSQSGARLGGVRQFKQAGDTIGVEFKGNKARFYVAWVGRTGTSRDGQVGLRAIDPKKNIWTMTLPAATIDKYQAPHIHNPSSTSELLSFLEYRNDRRLSKRVYVKAGARIAAAENSGWGICSDVSCTGCYVETHKPLPLGTKLSILLRLRDREMNAQGQVRRIRPGFGMGIEFLEMSDEDIAFLAETVAPRKLGRH
ncbi:MAG TPA: PilZ domain-containing protein [Terriglobales bacterium]|nr:PilZ domain-containing protein [Terriglobales bacterium]